MAQFLLGGGLMFTFVLKVLLEFLLLLLYDVLCFCFGSGGALFF